MGLTDIFSRSRTNLVSSILQFPAIDTDGMLKKMRLRDRARDQARKNLPGPDSVDFDSVEQDIVNEIENEGKTQFNVYMSHQKTYADRAGDAAIQALVLKIGSIAPSAATRFERNTRVGTGDLYALKRDVIETEKELNRFRQKNRLERPARDIGSRTYKIGLLILILAVESVLNGFFLQKGSVFGLAGGIFEALLIAALNVFIGAAVGRLVFSAIAHRNWAVRLLGILGTIAYLLAAVGFNLAVAHYRNAVSGDPFEASVIAYKTLLANPFGLYDLQSWSLFLFGFFFSLIAAYDGLRMDDPYPGYGHRMRQNLTALDDYNGLKDELLGELETIKNDTDAALDDLIRTIQSRQGEFDYIAVKSQALKAEMQQHFAHLGTAGNTLLKFYRDENRKERAASPPAHFDQPWAYHPPSLEGTTIDPGGAQIELVAKALKEIPKQRQDLEAAYRKAIREYKRIDDLVE